MRAFAPIGRIMATVNLVSLGCPKALVDSEAIVTGLALGGHALTESAAEADVVVINTCGFIDAAREESFEAIERALADHGRVIVTGCLGTGGEALTARYPELLAVTPPQAARQVIDAVTRVAPPANDVEYLVGPAGVRLTPPHYAYLKISEGCNHTCSFCIIPSMRGKLRSRPADDVLAEAERLAEANVREVMVIAQDTSAYGLDIRYAPRPFRDVMVESRIEPLARALGGILPWVRLHYVYPYPHVDRLIPLMADGLVLPYLDVPLQHAEPRILKAMRRPAATERTLERIRRWREICPDLTIRSTFIVGFPGETDADFEALIDFLAAAELDRVGCFTYSPVAGARANALPDPVDEDVKLDRQEALLEFQAGISARRLARRVGTTIEVLIDSIEDGMVLGRSQGDAPEIDGVVEVQDGRGLVPGDLVQVRVTAASDHDLVATLVGRRLKID
jgi:ribosomal protein S12 methylthiotransferase